MHVDLEAWIGESRGNRIAMKHRMSCSEARALAYALDELLELLDVPLPTEMPKGLDPNPELTIPAFLRARNAANAEAL